VVNFGSKKGQPLKELVDSRSNFLRWILENNFPSDTKDLIRKAFEGTYPPPPLTENRPTKFKPAALGLGQDRPKRCSLAPNREARSPSWDTVSGPKPPS